MAQQPLLDPAPTRVVRVRASDGKRYYRVTLDGRYPATCECMAFRFAKGRMAEKPECKHIRRARARAA